MLCILTIALMLIKLKPKIKINKIENTENEIKYGYIYYMNPKYRSVKI